jgi:tetratricopeptide (TPR) repeat protein
MGFLTMRDGKTEPVRSDERLVPAFWNLAERFGFKVGVIGWYASWPAEEVNGFLISDRIGYHQVKGSAERSATGLTYPPELHDEITPIWRRIEENLGPQATGRFFNPGEGGRVAIDQERLDTFVGILRTTELYRALVPWLLDRDNPDLMAVYFEGTDSAGHLFAEFQPPPLPGTDERMAEQLGEAFDRYYEYIDTVVGEIVAKLDPAETTLIIVSDHGFKSGEARPRVPSKSEHGDQAPIWHRPEGVILLWGRSVRSGVELPESSLFDVLPTTFRALGAPLAQNLPGRVIEEAFNPELLAHEVPSVDVYAALERPEEFADVDLPSDEVIAKLQALGYVGSTGGPVEGGQSSLPLNRFNLGVVLLNDGKRSEALEIFRSLQQEVPQFALGYLGEGLVLLQERRFADATAVMEKAVALGSEFPAIHAALGEAYLGMGRPADAVRSLNHALELDAGDGRTALLLGQITAGNGRHDRAEPLFERALQFCDSSLDRAAAAVGLAVVNEERRDLEKAAQLYEEALRILPDFPRALERYGNLELYRGEHDHALELLSRLVQVSGGSESTRALYDRALSIAGMEKEAP